MKIQGQVVRRGAVTRGFVETRGYAMGIGLRLPFVAVRGRSAGRTLVVLAAQHGRELNGPAAIHRVLRHLRPASMQGTILFFPVVHPVAVHTHVQDFPTERTRSLRGKPPHNPINLNRNWPGDPRGTYHQRITGALWPYIERADLVLDLHGWTDRTVGLTWGQRYSAKHVRRFAFPWMEVHDAAPTHGMLEWACRRKKIPYVINESTPQDRVQPRSVDHVERGILNLARGLEIIGGSIEHPPRSCELGGPSVTVAAEAFGLVVTDHIPGDIIDRGQVLLEVVDLERFRPVQRVRAPSRMVVRNVGCTWGTGMLTHDVVQPGDTIGSLSSIAREYEHGRPVRKG